jgi:hypothetical protein
VTRSVLFVLVAASVFIALMAVACIGSPPIPPVASDMADPSTGDTGIDSSVDHAADAQADAQATDDQATDAAAETQSDAPAPLQNFPSHTVPTAYFPDASSLPSGVQVIDTGVLALQFADAATGVPPGVTFELDSTGNAVLSIGSWTVNEDVQVRGAARLIVVAAGPVVVNATIHGEASGETGGPGAPTLTTASWGQNGFVTGGSVNGAGGGGFGSQGGSGGGTGQVALGGPVFGSSVLDYSAGAPGGNGSLVCTGPSKGYGGGGGGAVQISSSVSITVTTSGAINAAGGGGLGGCSMGSGGGGGSGGTVFLEAPSLSVSGMLAANGGGGGTGDDSEGLGNSYPGSDGKLATSPAPGGSSSNGENNSGGAGAAGTLGPDGGPAIVPAGSGSSTVGAPASGGGGGVGRIWLRSRGLPSAVDATKISPPAASDTTL